MRKKVFGRHLSRGRKSRTALFRSQIRALVLSGKIETTRAKAKAIQGEAEKLVSLSKKGTVSIKRNVLSKLGNDRETVEKLFLKIAPAFEGRNSGFTRIIPLPARLGDAAEMARIEWTEQIIDKKSTPKAVIQSKKKGKIRTESEKKS